MFTCLVLYSCNLTIISPLLYICMLTHTHREEKDDMKNCICNVLHSCIRSCKSETECYLAVAIMKGCVSKELVSDSKSIAQHLSQVFSTVAAHPLGPTSVF